MRGEWAHWTGVTEQTSQLTSSGVTVHHDYLGRGISTNLYKVNCELLKLKGFKGALAENVSAFSAKAAENCGAQLVAKQEYTTWEYPAGSGQFPLACVKPPHKYFQLREAQFSQ